MNDTKTVKLIIEIPENLDDEIERIKKLTKLAKRTLAINGLQKELAYQRQLLLELQERDR